MCKYKPNRDIYVLLGIKKLENTHKAEQHTTQILCLGSGVEKVKIQNKKMCWKRKIKKNSELPVWRYKLCLEK